MCHISIGNLVDDRTTEYYRIVMPSLDGTISQKKLKQTGAYFEISNKTNFDKLPIIYTKSVTLRLITNTCATSSNSYMQYKSMK
jgi:hypothetical protein